MAIEMVDLPIKNGGFRLVLVGVSKKLWARGARLPSLSQPLCGTCI
jgi:hypothetical protein